MLRIAFGSDPIFNNAVNKLYTSNNIGNALRMIGKWIIWKP